WAGKLAGAVVRIAGILHAAENIPTKTAVPAAIPSETVARAVSLARDYLIPHALAAFGLMGADKRTEDARRVVARLRDSKVRTVMRNISGPWCISQRDIHALVLGSRYSAEDVEAIADLLVRHLYLRPPPAETKTGRGRPASPLYEANPAIFVNSVNS